MSMGTYTVENKEYGRQGITEDEVLMDEAVSCLMEGNKGKNKVTDGRSRCGNRGDFCFYRLI